ncbi:MAG TPA: MFS transporter [Candidatus Dojkabacteria bacterium]|nr:MFS transporter [Candidatus Dojkabacteria bacterium]
MKLFFQADNLLKKMPAMAIFLIPLLLIYFTDSILSFIFPIVVENLSDSNTLLGLIMSLSALIGLICDLIFPQYLKKHSWRFMLFLAIIIEFIFLLTTIFGQMFQVIGFFLLGSLIWGIYYELLYFYIQNFMVVHEQQENYTKFWSVIYAAAYVTGIIGPIIGSYLLEQPLEKTAIPLFLLISLAAVFAFLSLARFHGAARALKYPEGYRHKSKFSILKELRVWKIFSKRILPLIIISLTLVFIEATFYTIGGLFGQEITEEITTGFLANANLDWVPMILYSFPMTIGNIIISRLNISHGKKRQALKFLLFGSLLLIPIGIFPRQYLLIFLSIFLASLMLSFSGPLLQAVFSDLVKRSQDFKEDLVGLSSATSSLAYIIGPVVIGILADNTGYHTTFAIIGSAGVLIAVLFLLIMPKKLKVPLGELNHSETSNG